MNVQVITREGEPEYAVLPWAEFQALLKAAGLPSKSAAPEAAAPQLPMAKLSQMGNLRQGLGLSIEQLARTVGISPSYLELIETAERQPDAAIRRALARALSVAGWSDPS